MTGVRKRIAIKLTMKCRPPFRKGFIRRPRLHSRIEARSMRAVYVAGGQTLDRAEMIVSQ